MPVLSFQDLMGMVEENGSIVLSPVAPVTGDYTELDRKPIRGTHRACPVVSQYYVNMDSKGTNIMKVPSVADLEANNVRIRDAIIPEGQSTVALRFFVDNETQDECEINIELVSGSGIAIFTGSPSCKISYKKSENSPAGLKTVYDIKKGWDPPEYVEQDLDAQLES